MYLIRKRTSAQCGHPLLWGGGTLYKMFPIDHGLWRLLAASGAQSCLRRPKPIKQNGRAEKKACRLCNMGVNLEFCSLLYKRLGRCVGGVGLKPCQWLCFFVHLTETIFGWKLALTANLDGLRNDNWLPQSTHLSQDDLPFNIHVCTNWHAFQRT